MKILFKSTFSTERPFRSSVSTYRGNYVDFVAEFKSYNQVLTPESATAYYQTIDDTQTIYKFDSVDVVDSKVIAHWLPNYDFGAKAYRIWIETSDEVTGYPAMFEMSMLENPVWTITSPSPPPINSTIDFSKYTLLNAPWVENEVFEEFEDDVNAKISSLNADIESLAENFEDQITDVTSSINSTNQNVNNLSSDLSGTNQIVSNLSTNLLDFQINVQSNYALKSEIPTVPTKTSELTNDSGYITSSDIPDVDLTNYYTKTQTDVAIKNAKNYYNISDVTTTDIITLSKDISVYHLNGTTLPSIETINTQTFDNQYYNFEIEFTVPSGTTSINYDNWNNYTWLTDKETLFADIESIAGQTMYFAGRFNTITLEKTINCYSIH